MSRMRDVCVCVFAKPPRPGEVKTRLAPQLGDEGAAALAHAFFLDTWATSSELPWAQSVLATTDVASPEWSQLPQERVWSQGRGTLGDRLERILRRALRSWPTAIAVGTDLPGLPPALFDSARQALQSADAVLGPVDDGGFYLIGLRACPVGLLADLPWSAPDTFTRTLGRLRSRGLQTTIVPPWFDVDEPMDLLKLRAMLERGRLHAPATARVLGIHLSSAERTGRAK
jgi:rSAM/selenodomain-associated transferase 1